MSILLFLTMSSEEVYIVQQTAWDVRSKFRSHLQWMLKSVTQHSGAYSKKSTYAGDWHRRWWKFGQPSLCLRIPGLSGYAVSAMGWAHDMCVSEYVLNSQHGWRKTRHLDKP